MLNLRRDFSIRIDCYFIHTREDDDWTACTAYEYIITKLFFSLSLCSCLGVTISTLLGRKGSLEKMKDYWDVGFYLGANILANEHRKVIEASEKLYRINAPVWWELSTYSFISVSHTDHLILMLNFIRHPDIFRENAVLYSVCVICVWFLQVYCIHYGDVHLVSSVCQVAWCEISQTGNYGLLDGAAFADLQAHRLNRSLSSKTTRHQ